MNKNIGIFLGIILLIGIGSERVYSQSEATIGPTGITFTSGLKNAMSVRRQPANFTVLDENGAEAGYWVGVENTNVGELTNSLPEDWSFKALPSPAFYQLMTTEEN